MEARLRVGAAEEVAVNNVTFPPYREACVCPRRPGTEDVVHTDECEKTSLTEEHVALGKQEDK